VEYHFVYNKCQKCNGYNTKLLNTIKRDATAEDIKEHETKSLISIQSLTAAAPQEQSLSDNDEPLNADNDDEPLNAENAVSLMHGSPSLPPGPSPNDSHMAGSPSPSENTP